VKRRPTIKDVAKATSFSISTVSLVLNNQPHVSDQTRRKVLQVIAELGYHPNRGARGLASRLTGNIGFIISDDHFTQVEPFYTRIFLGTEFESRDHDYYVLLTTVGKRFNKKNPSVPRYLLERNVDGVIIAGKISEALVEHIDRLALPMVLVDYALKHRRISSVLIDNRSGVRAAILHLIQGGHREIAFIGGDLQHPSIAERCEAYREILEEHNLTYKPSLVVTDETDTRVHNGYNAAERLLKQGGKPTAIFAANDAMAIGCMQYLKAVGKRIPDDVAVVGFDDIEISSHVEPRLTTVRVPKEEMGKLAVRLLVDIIKSKVETITTVHIPVELVVRESSGTGQEHDVRNAGVSSTLAF